ncbi:MAG: hypothetical protein AUG17_04300 [Crenarchaeota archaeon 13_1_20CM_2_53_14]|nr:MAG: hypothetical protein AUI07_09665 [archaeon 13_2_20CM_2_53_6]OLE59099.1 MAG: hypothetical protein AUG17_04300 [Crenarchaeota archaeon 13_1_20CM_2_53_14]
MKRTLSMQLLRRKRFNCEISPIASTSYVGEDKTSLQGSQTADVVFLDGDWREYPFKIEPV